MPPPDDWIGIRALAVLAGITRQKARMAAKRASAGKRWRDAALVARKRHGRGGDGGGVWEISVPSLPPELRAKVERERAAALPVPVPAAPIALLKPDRARSKWEGRLRLIQPALDALENGEPTGPVLDKIAGAMTAAYAIDRRQMKPRTAETLRQWVAAYRGGGVGALDGKPRADRGKRRVAISKRIDGIVAAKTSKEKLAEIGAELAAYRERRWLSADNGRRHAAMDMTVKLRELLHAAGVALTDAEARACRVPQHYARPPSNTYRNAFKARTDARDTYDRQSPYVRRDRSGLVPMQVVEGDVHPIDIYYRRPDGTVATPKAIAWCDLATNRLFVTVVFLDAGKGITQAHVIASFIDMVVAWGVPSQLVLDNGSEYADTWTALTDDTVRLKRLAAGETWAALGDGLIGLAAVLRTKAYNARAKVIESLFKTKENGVFSLIAGHVGGDRTRKKTHNLGRPPAPFPGTTEELRVQIAAAVMRYEITPQDERAHLAGKSPRESFEDFVRAGWRPVTIDRALLEAVFSTRERRTVAHGAITISGGVFTARELAARTGDRLEVWIPKVGDLSRVAIVENGALLCFAEKQRHFPYGDREGARQQASRQKGFLAAVRKNAADPLDMGAETQRLIALHPQSVVPQSAGEITLSPLVHDIAEGRRALPAPAQQQNTLSPGRQRQREAIRHAIEQRKVSDGR